jgi:hypothetical protein
METAEHERMTREAVRQRPDREAGGKPTLWVALRRGLAGRAERALAAYGRDPIRRQGYCVVFCGQHTQP